MTAQETIQRDYMVTARRLSETENGYRVTYVPRGLQAVRRRGASRRVPEYVALAQVQDREILVTWETQPPDPKVMQEDFDQDVRVRVGLLHEWIGRLNDLAFNIRGWAEELGWSARKVDKPMKDLEIGDYNVPGLVLQRDMTRIGLEPTGRAAPGSEGLVDLYVLPAYDDIAGLFFYDNRWHLSHPGRSSEAVEDRLLTKKAFRALLDQMTKNGQ